MDVTFEQVLTQWRVHCLLTQMKKFESDSRTTNVSVIICQLFGLARNKDKIKMKNARMVE
jgi:hypothetical protein